MKNAWMSILMTLILASAAVADQANQSAPLLEIETAIIQGEHAQAEKLAQTFLDSRPSRELAERARYFLALSVLNLEQPQKARGLFEEIIAAKPAQEISERSRLGIIDSYYLEGDYKKALESAQQMNADLPRSKYASLVYLKIARASLKLTNWPQAKSYLNKIVSTYPSSLESHIAKQLLAERRYFAVQVGSFLDRDRAFQVVQELKEQGEYSYIVETKDPNGDRYYRVRVGKFSQLDKAEEVKEKMSNRGYPTRIYP